jgi:hypothetical protein
LSEIFIMATSESESLMRSHKQILPEHSKLLATKWLTAQQLVSLAQNEDMSYKQGRFSAEERQLVCAAVQSYQTVRQVV